MDIIVDALHRCHDELVWLNEPFTARLNSILHHTIVVVQRGSRLGKAVHCACPSVAVACCHLKLFYCRGIVARYDIKHYFFAVNRVVRQIE